MEKSIKFEVSTTRDDFFKDYFNIINGTIGLSNKEIVVLAALVEQYNIIREKTSNEDIINELLFSSRYRTLARERTNLEDLNFNNYVSALKRKGVILEEENNFRKLNPMLIPVVDLNNQNGVTVSFTLKIEEQNEQEESGRDAGNREENGEWDIIDEIPPFEFPTDTGTENEDAEESLTFFDEQDDATELLDRDTSGEGND